MPNAVFTACSFTPKFRIRRLAKKYSEISCSTSAIAKATGRRRSSLKEEIEKIREIVGPTDNVVCGLSGGVDSTVAAVLVHEAIGDAADMYFCK